MAKKKNEAAVALGRLGGLKGGKARAKALTKAERSEIAAMGAAKRAKSLTKAERSEIAKKAAAKRWAKKRD